MASRKPETIQDFCDRLNISVKVLDTTKPGLDEDGHLASCFSNLELDRDGGEKLEITWFWPDEVLDQTITPTLAMAGFRDDCDTWRIIDVAGEEQIAREAFVDMSDEVWAETKGELKIAHDKLLGWLGPDEMAKLLLFVVRE